MTDRKRCFCRFSVYEQEAIQETLESMAASGWMIEKTGNYFWTYKKTVPRRVRFAVTYFPDSSDFDPGITDEEKAKIDFCARDGWIFAAKWGPVQIFYTENEDAVPIETDPVTQVENIHAAIKKSRLRAAIFTGALLVYYIVMHILRLVKDPVGFLSDPVQLYSMPVFWALLASILLEILRYYRWRKRAVRAARENGIFLPARFRRTAEYIFIGIAVFFLILAYGSALLAGKMGIFVLLWACAMLACIAAGRGIRHWLKRKDYPRDMNIIASVGGSAILAVMCLGILVAAVIGGGFTFEDTDRAVGTYEHRGIRREIYADPMPLTIEDMRDTASRFTREADEQETVLLFRGKYRQSALMIEGNRSAGGTNDMDYSIIDAKCPFLTKFVLQTLLDAHQDEVDDEGWVFTDHYETIDSAIWNADEAYRLHWSGVVTNTYLIRWGNRIVEIEFAWTPTQEEIVKAADLLKPAGTISCR